MIESAYTIGSPWAMMVHALYAFVADTTVMYSGFFDKIAFGAIADFVECFDFVPAWLE